MRWGPVNFFQRVNFGPATDGQKTMHMSRPCISTGVLTNDIIGCCSKFDLTINFKVLIEDHMYHKHALVYHQDYLETNIWSLALIIGTNI